MKRKKKAMRSRRVQKSDGKPGREMVDRAIPAKALYAHSEAYHRENLADQLLDAALEIVKLKGAHAVSLREVARRSGVSHMAPYRHFKDKEALLAGVAERGFRKLTAMLDMAFQADRPQSDGMKKAFEKTFHCLGQQYVQFILTNKETAQIMFGGFVNDMSRYQSAHEAGDMAFNQLLRIIRIGQEQGQFDRSIDADALGVMIWSQVHGFAMLLAENQFGFLDVAQRDIFLKDMQMLMTSTLLRGLSPTD